MQLAVHTPLTAATDLVFPENAESALSHNGDVQSVTDLVSKEYRTGIVVDVGVVVSVVPPTVSQPATKPSVEVAPADEEKLTGDASPAVVMAAAA